MSNRHDDGFEPYYFEMLQTPATTFVVAVKLGAAGAHVRLVSNNEHHLHALSREERAALFDTAIDAIRIAATMEPTNKPLIIPPSGVLG